MKTEEKHLPLALLYIHASWHSLALKQVLWSSGVICSLHIHLHSKLPCLSAKVSHFILLFNTLNFTGKEVLVRCLSANSNFNSNFNFNLCTFWKACRMILDCLVWKIQSKTAWSSGTDEGVKCCPYFRRGPAGLGPTLEEESFSSTLRGRDGEETPMSVAIRPEIIMQFSTLAEILGGLLQLIQSY